MSYAQVQEVGRRAIVLGESAETIARDMPFSVAAIGEQIAAARRNFVGPIEPCPCGRPAGHKGFCSERNWRPEPLSPEIERAIRADLLRGIRPRDIQSRFGIGHHRYLTYLRTLSPEEQSRRARLLRSRADATVATGAHTTAQRDTLFARILAAMPAGMEPALRDDACAEAYLAVLEGEIAADAIEREVPRLARAARSLWQDGFRSRSMDAPLGPDDDRTLGETFADDTAEALLSNVAIGAGPAPAKRPLIDLNRVPSAMETRFARREGDA